MALGDGIRKNVALVSAEERARLRDAIVLLATTKSYPDGVSYWRKQDQIHEATHVHNGPAFLPWHRELVNRFEALLREVDPAVSLHYWDWTTDPRNTSGINLFTASFMGSASGQAGPPFQMLNITREMSPGTTGFPADAQINAAGDSEPEAGQFPAWRTELESVHGQAHGYVGGTIGDGHTAFEDPFVFLLHSEVDRLFAKWQLAPGRGWRLDPDRVYGSEENTTGVRGILTPMEPWAGGSSLRPWAPPENQQVSKNSRHPSVVWPPLYDFDVQSGWRWCSRCQGLFFGTNPGSTCPEGGEHTSTGSGNYVLLNNAQGAPGQANWRWCNKCQGLFFGGGAASSTCPEGGTHTSTGSGNYTLMQRRPNLHQSNWRWCNKCQGLFFGGGAASSTCPEGGTHSSTGSGNYRLIQNLATAPGQHDWRWCNKCQGLFFGANAASSTCPEGGTHTATGSGNYALISNAQNAPGQPNWRWCNRCQGLFFAGNAGSTCPEGGPHSAGGSGNYTLLPGF